MAKIISLLIFFLKRINYLIYKFSIICKFFIIYLESNLVKSVSDSKEQSTYYEPFSKFQVDGQPIIEKVEKLNFKDILHEYLVENGKELKPVSRRSPSKLNFKGNCPVCGAPHEFIYENNIKSKQLLCKVCNYTFTLNKDYLDKVKFRCPHCSRTLDKVKERSGYFIYKCRNDKCSFYIDNLNKLTKNQMEKFKSNPGDFKVRYIYRAFNIDYPNLIREYMPELNMKVDLANIRHSKHVLGLILTYYVNYGLSSRKTAAIMYDIHQVKVSHQTVHNYVNSVATIMTPLLENYPYELTSDLCGDETYIKVKGKKHYVFFFSDKVKKIITSYQTFSKRDTFSAVKAMYQTFRKYLNNSNELPNDLKVVVDGNPIYNAAQVYFKSVGINFDLYQVIGLTNDTQTDKDYRPFKQVTERLNRTFKDDYIQMNGFGNIRNANSYMVLFTTFFNFLRPHKTLAYNTPVVIDKIKQQPHMPSKWLSLLDLSYSYLK